LHFVVVRVAISLFKLAIRRFSVSI